MSSSHSRGGSNGHQFGDTTLTKVFVGGLAWETPKDSLKEHFEKYGHILEAVIISDKLTGRSKGYGFVTFKEAEAAAKACEDAGPVINGRRANCNLASLGAKRDKPATLSPSPSPTPPQPVTITAGLNLTTNGGGNVISTGQLCWYYPAPPPPPLHHHHQAVPYYGFSPAPPAYVATNINYNQKIGGGFYSNGQMHPMAAGHNMMPMCPLYQYHHNHNQSMSVPAHVFSPLVPAFIPKPTTTFVSPNPTGGGAMVGV